MNLSDVVLLVGLVGLMSPFIWMVTRTEPERGCPECGSVAIQKNREQNGMRVCDARGSQADGYVVVQEQFIVHHHCMGCGHKYTTTMTESR